VSAPQYHETLLSLLYPGRQTSVNSLRSTVEVLEEFVGIRDRHQRHQILIRLDAGFGSDTNINWLLHRGYHILTKGYSSKRARAVAHRVRHWKQLDRGKWIAPVPDWWAGRYYRRTQTALLCWQQPKSQRVKYALLITSLCDADLVHLNDLYDDRARIENEIKADKGGLLLPRRRKKHVHAQEALVLLTDLAHNILAWTRRFWAAEPAIGDVGLYCIINDILTIPGKLLFHDRQLVKFRLKATHPLAKPVVACLGRILCEF
jgi:hypothetical protein